MSLHSILHTVGKDLSHLGAWIEDGLKIAEPILEVAAAIDPPLIPLMGIITQADQILTGLLSQGGKLNAQNVQAIITSIATLEMAKSRAQPQPLVMAGASPTP